MNERIRELAEQADEYADAKLGMQGEYHPDWHDVRDEKFVELIVRECADVCDLLLDHKISSEWSRATHDCSRAIRKHFGV